MRYRTALLLMFSCGFLAGQTPSESSITVMLEGGVSVPRPVLAGMEREADFAVAQSGIALAWESKESASPSASYNRLAIIRLEGHCTPERLPSASSSIRGAEPLGRTQVVDGKVLPIADISCDALHRLIDRDLAAAPRSEQGELLGRALGRVVAHELYHILLRTTSHGTSGLSRPVQTSSELLAPHDSFTPADADRIANSVSDAGR